MKIERRAAFSLVEVALALAIFATVGAVLVGILGTSLNVTRDTLSEAEMTMLAENIQARLILDPSWPGAREAVWFDDSGAEVKEEKGATFGISFESVDGAGFKSDFFETFRVAVRRLPNAQEIGTWTLQRARLIQGNPIAVP